jgi:DsbE subfamily thiol:disulfide oxidoreductase
MRSRIWRHAFLGQLLLAVVFLPIAHAQKPDYGSIPKLQEIKEHPEAPDFTLPDPAGNRRSLKDYRGKVVMLAFWASWCPYCREELPAMERLYREFKGKGLEIVGVNIKDKRDEALALVKKNGITYPVLMDPEGEIGLLYGAFATPTVYLIDRKGTVLARMWGPAGWYSPEARKLIAALVEQKP